MGLRKAGERTAAREKAEGCKERERGAERGREMLLPKKKKTMERRKTEARWQVKFLRRSLRETRCRRGRTGGKRRKTRQKRERQER